MRAIVDHPELAIFGVETEPPARTLVDILSATMDAHPEEVAIESATATITYSQLRGLLDEQAARLHAKGIGPGDRVGIRVPSGTTDLYVAILSTLWAGAAYVPVDWDDPDSRADTVWEEASVAAVYGKDLAIVDKHGGWYLEPAEFGQHLCEGTHEGGMCFGEVNECHFVALLE